MSRLNPIPLGMNNELTKVQDDSEYGKSLVDLPAELLVKILWYLPISDRVKIRYVSRRFRDVSNTPSLWKVFVWPDYEPRHVRSVSNVLRVCGEHVRRIFFPAHVTSTDIMEMVQCCRKLTHLSLPKGTQLNLDHVEDIVHTLTHLQELDVPVCQ